jgi:hypothetical protein
MNPPYDTETSGQTKSSKSLSSFEKFLENEKIFWGAYLLGVVTGGVCIAYKQPQALPPYFGLALLITNSLR